MKEKENCSPHVSVSVGCGSARCRVPDGKFLTVLFRAGTKPAIEEGRLQAIEPPAPKDTERWLSPYNLDKFTKDFTKSARRQ